MRQHDGDCQRRSHHYRCYGRGNKDPGDVPDYADRDGMPHRDDRKPDNLRRN